MILVIGSNGMLGNAVQNELLKNNLDYRTVDIFGDTNYCANISDLKSLESIFINTNFDSIINCAGWAAVDAAEDIANRNKVNDVNVKGIENLYIISKKYNCKLLHISSDYVFDGKGTTPWKENDVPNKPLNYYGLTKLHGEKTVERLEKFFIVRTQWLFGKNGNNFVNTMLNVAKSHEEVRVVNDQIGSPTYVNDLAKVLVEMIQTDKYGYYHVASSGDYVSWYDFCREIYKQTGLSTKVIPVTTEEYGNSKAIRPHNSRLDRTKYVECGFTKLPDWKESLNKYLKDTNRI